MLLLELFTPISMVMDSIQYALKALWIFRESDAYQTLWVVHQFTHQLHTSTSAGTTVTKIVTL